MQGALMTEAARNIELHEPVGRKSGQIMPRLLRISRNLNEPAGWLFELAQIYRLARRGQLATEDASRLAFICSSAGKLAKDTEYLRYIAALGERFEKLQQMPPAAYGSEYGDSSDDAAIEPDVVTP
jgi:hypothetical protein